LTQRDSIRSAGFDFFGHELVLHVVSREDATDHRRASGGANAVVRHFGIYLRRSKWEEAIGSLAGYEGGILGPLDGPQGSYLLVEDPAGNVIELKTDEPGKEG
jgi:extradiol dioxygenase family protein